MSQTKTPNVEPLTYANEQTLPDGTYIAYDVHVEGDHFVCTTTAGREESTEVLAPAESDLFAVLAMKPEVLRVGTGITEITTSGPVSVHRLLGALVVDDPDAEMVQADAWADLASHASWLGVNVDRWREQDLEMTAMRVPEGCELVPRWITINGDRGFVLRGEQIAEQLVDQAKG